MLSDHDLRPCHSRGTQPNACAMAHYRRLIDNHITLHGPWTGWRMAGRDLVAPDGQRINPERLRGLLFRQAAESRIARTRQDVGTCSNVLAHLPRRERLDGAA